MTERPKDPQAETPVAEDRPERPLAFGCSCPAHAGWPEYHRARLHRSHVFGARLKELIDEFWEFASIDEQRQIHYILDNACENTADALKKDEFVPRPRASGLVGFVQ
jgi:hypothetical protein